MSKTLQSSCKSICFVIQKKKKEEKRRKALVLLCYINGLIGNGTSSDQSIASPEGAHM